MGTFANIVSSYGLKSNGTNAMDVVNGIPIRIYNNDGNAIVFVYCGKDRVKEAIGPVKNAAAMAEIKKPAISGEAISFAFKKSKLAVEHYERIRKIVSDNASYFGVDQCPYCFMSNCDVAGMYRSSVARRMHRQCFLNQRNNQMDMVNTSDGNYITGIIGALIAAIIIVAFADFIVLGANKLYYILYIAFPLFIAGGFRLGKGPYGPMGTFCHVIISVLAMFAYFYIQGCYYASQWYDVTLFQAVPYFGDIMMIITDSDFLSASAAEIVLFVIGLIVGIVYNPTSKKAGRKTIQQDDIFITPVTALNAFGGYDAVNNYSGAGGYDGFNGYDQAGAGQSAADGFGGQNGFVSSYDNSQAYGSSYGNDSSNNGF